MPEGYSAKRNTLSIIIIEPIDYIITAVYLLLWLIALFLYHRKNYRWDSGTLVIGLNILYTLFAFVTMSDAFCASDYKPLKMFPYIFLFVMMMIAFVPQWYYHERMLDKDIQNPHSRLLVIAGWSIAVLAFLIIPDIIANFKTGFIQLLIDSDAGHDAYNEQLSNIVNQGKSIGNLPAILYNATSEIGIFLFFYFLSLRQHKWLILCLGLNMLVSLLVPVMNGLRGPVIAAFLAILAAYFLFENRLSANLVKIIRIAGITLFALISIPITAITVSRFEEEKAGVASSLSRYIGQGPLYFNNYALDDGGIRYGDRTFYLLKRVIDPSTPTNYLERRMKYGHLKIDDEVFSTYVGDFCIDLGPIFAFLLFVVFNAWVVSQMRVRGKNDTIYLHQMLLLFFTICIMVQGSMSLYSFADLAGLKIIAIAVLYFYLKYHQALLEKFPCTSVLKE